MLVGLGLAVALAGCGLVSQEPPAQTCATPSEGTRLTDDVGGFELCLPAPWRDLAAGDPGWRLIHGGDTSTEDRVASGDIAHFAVPLEPRESDVVVNVTVYVQAVPADTTLTAVADSYQKVLAGLESTTIVDREDVSLPAGAAVRFTSTIARAADPRVFLERRVAYLVVHGGRAYYFDFASSDKTAEEHLPVFDAIARSVRFGAGGTDPSP
jgi:hypothetical protein